VNLTVKFLNLGASHSRGISLNLVINPFNQYNYKKESKQTFYFFFVVKSRDFLEIKADKLVEKRKNP
jgi:hypothetical protein